MNARGKLDLLQLVACLSHPASISLHPEVHKTRKEGVVEMSKQPVERKGFLLRSHSKSVQGSVESSKKILKVIEGVPR